MQKTKQIYEGKAKIVYETDSPEHLILFFKDDATAFNAEKRGVIDRKGIMNNKISAKIFQYLSSHGVPTHYETTLSDREMLVKRLQMIPLEVIIRNRAAGSLCRLLEVAEGSTLDPCIFEFTYKNDRLKDPLVNEYHIRTLKILSEEEVERIKEYTFLINVLLTKFFLKLNVELIDFKLEFGRLDGKIVLADEISPDTSRLWEIGTGNYLDKDRFRKDLGNIEEAYAEVLNRINR